jgi:hypothetical protein
MKAVFITGACQEDFAMNATLFITSTVAAATIATQVLAAEACLQRNRLQSWRAIDNSTMVMTDIEMNQYTVHMKGRCSNLSRPDAKLVYRTWTNLGCLHSGDVIAVTAAGLGTVTCSVANVEAGAPGAAPA